MPFPRNLLNDGEDMVLDLRPHWLYLFPSVAASVALVILALLVFVRWDPQGNTGTGFSWLFIVAFVAVLAWFGWRYAKWVTTMFVLTTDRIVTRNGVISKSGIDVPLDRVNTVFFSQNLFERLVGAGDLAIESAGERGTSHFKDIRRPSIVQKEIYVQIEANENRKFDRMRMPSTSSGPAPAQDLTIPEQIDQLAELHQRGVLSDAEFARKKTELLDRM